MNSAVRELASFISVVTKLFGAEQAKLSAEDWLSELVATGDLPTSAEMWRRVTVYASAQLARRVVTEDALDACV